MIMYLLDANVLIRAEADYYPQDRFPKFWDWIIEMATLGKIKIPLKIYGEILAGTGSLPQWLRLSRVRNCLELDETVDDSVVDKLINEHYAPDLNEFELKEIGKDPYLLAEAQVRHDSTDLFLEECVIVTKENSRPNAQRHNRKIPDICNDLNIRCIDDFQMYRELDLRMD